MAIRARASLTAAVSISIFASLLFAGTAAAVPDAWSPVGNNGNTPALSPPANITALLATDDGVLIGGDFFNAGGPTGAKDSFVLWDGSSFSAFGDNGALPTPNGYFDTPGDYINAIAIKGDDIYVGGSFTNNSGDANADYIVMWDDSQGQWEALGPGLPDQVNAIAIDGDDVYAGGDFVNVGGDPLADYLVMWDGGQWSAVGDDGAGGSALSDHVNALAIKNGNVFVGGLFQNAGGVDAADYIAKWNGSAWSSLGSINPSPYGVLTGEVRSILIDGSNTWVAGSFTNANNGNADMDYVAKWSNSTWSDLNTGGVITNFVHTLAVDGDDLYIGGGFAQMNGPRDRVAKWDGSSWSALGGTGNAGALNNTVNALAVWEGDLYVGGMFTDVMGEVESDYLVSWGLQPEFKPDARIRSGNSGSWTGNDIYNTTGQNQKQQQTGPRNALKHYQISIQNDSPTESDVFYVRASAGSTNKYTITYMVGASDETAAILSVDGYETAVLAAGAQLIIDVDVQYNNASAGSKVSRVVSVESDGDGAKLDAVKLVAKR